MELTTNQVVLVLLGCAAAIAGIFVLYRRGVFGKAKVEDKTPVGATKS